MGIRILHVATLEANMVKKLVITSVEPNIKFCGNALKTDKDCPSILAIPLTLLPSASAKPPPK